MRSLRARVAEYLLRRTGGVDAQWYLTEYPEVARSGVDPHRHYAERGAAEGLLPCPIPLLDDARWAALIRRGINPLLHVRYGPLAALLRQPGRQVRPSYRDAWHTNGLTPRTLRGATALDRPPVAGSPRITVVIPCYNSARYIGSRLASVLWQRYPVHQLLILDDASTDDTLGILRGLEHTWGRSFPVRRRARNSGSPFIPWLEALPHCTGDVVWIAEADDMAHPDFLATLAPAFQSARTGIAYANSMSIDAQGHILHADMSAWVHGKTGALVRSAFTAPGPEFAACHLSVQNCLPNVSAVLYRREALAAALARCEDDLRRLRQTGDWLVHAECLREHDITYDPQVLNACRRHGASHTFNFDPLGHLAEVCAVQDHVLAEFASADAHAEAAHCHRLRLGRHLKLDDDAIARVCGSPVAS